MVNGGVRVLLLCPTSSTVTKGIGYVTTYDFLNLEKPFNGVVSKWRKGQYHNLFLDFS